MKTTPAGPAYLGTIVVLCAAILALLGQLLRPAERGRGPQPKMSELLRAPEERAAAEPLRPELSPLVADPAVRVIGLAPPPRPKESPYVGTAYAGTAIGVVFEANGGRLPATGQELHVAAVLGRMLKRLATDADMPPADSAEYELFRAKDLASFDAVRDFLESELRRARGD
jgi:hypothetical protein